jgi:Carboxypeptidase regulatory-like domain
MYRSSAKRLSAFIVSIAFVLAGGSTLLGAEASQTPKVRFSVKHGKSAPIRDHKMVGPLVPRAPREVKNKIRPLKASAPGTTDSAVQRGFGGSPPPAELGQFEGGSDDQNQDVVGFRVAPPDTEGDIGPNHYVQYINLIVNIYDRDGNVESGPLPGNVFWEGLGDDCETSNDGDPIVLYDQLADRWFVSQFAFPSFPNPPYIQCVAVSVTGDPTGEYYQYQFNLPDTYLNDYPKFGIWPDGYYMTFNGFDLFGGGFQGAAIAFDRAAMLDGEPATMIQFSTGLEGGVLPSDMDGLLLPPPGTPNYFLTFNLPPSRLIMWEFHADFATPANSTFTQLPDLPVEDFITPICGSFRDQCVPQLDSPELLETLSHATMHRLAYRNHGTHQSLVTNHTVAVEGEGGNFAGIRWYELQIPGEAAADGLSNPWAVHQQQTYAPDENWRWMGSIAQDANGNIALGYSISSSEMHPSIAIAGRLSTAPLNELGTESIFLEGGGSQVNTASRWGDYSSMNIDPLDDCTFWYTQEYCQAECEFDWNTRVASFKFPSCTTGPRGTIEGTVTDGANPIEGANVLAGGSGTTTNAAGHYELTLPVGTYDMTVSKYGFFPASADDVVVEEDETTIQDFTLEAAPSTVVNGTVRDELGNWPLYARIQISGPGYPGATLWTDPVTGFYSVTLVEGITYTFLITAVSPGYTQGGGPLPLGVPLGNAPFLVHNWTLEADLEACSAPGYTFNTTGLFEEFSSGDIPPGWTVENLSLDGGPPWTVESGADPCQLFGGNETGGSGPYAIINSNCDGVLVTAVTNLITPSLNLSGIGSPVLRFNSDFTILNIDYPQLGEVDYSIDGGANWTNVFTFDTNLPGPSVWEAAIPSAADIKVRFHYDAFWSWWWQVDNVLVGEGSCDVGSGGLVVGHVTDAANGNGLNGATVQNIGGGSTKTFATPDPAQDDGLYILYAEAGPNDFEASLTNYQTAEASKVVVPGSTVELNFALLAGNLTLTPTALNARVNPGGTDAQEITITNIGPAPATFEIIEINAPLLPSETSGSASEALRQQALARLPRNAKGPEQSARSTQGLAAMPNRRPPGRPLAVGDVISSFNSEITYGWGVATVGSNIWLSNLGVAGGDDQDYEYTPDGAQTGNTVDDSSAISAWAGDGAFNPLTGNFWRVDVVDFGSSCIFEIDPVNKVVTGNTICPATNTSERGLAYDQATDTFYMGSWNDGVIFHFDTDGNIIDSAFVGLSISGLAYNSSNGHLLVMENIPGGNDITVLDALDNYDVLGSFQILDNGSPAITAFGGAGAEFDCLGNLWVIDQNTQTVYQVESGETAGCEVDIPWFAVDPETGTVPAAALGGGGTNPFPVQAQWNAGSLLPGLQQAQIAIKTDTPYQVPNIPVTLTVRFLDVPEENQFQAYIYGAAGAGVMMGGPPNCPAGVLNFCPDGDVTRADMAGYLWRAINGRNTPPPVYQNIFTDVTFNDYNAFYIQGIFEMGITAGCGDGTTYCPDDSVSRQQMSAFIWRGEHGDEPPPSCAGIFNDVPCPSQFADYIEGLFNEGVTAGCGNNNFCPTNPISNGQMAVFLVKAFGLPVLLP